MVEKQVLEDKVNEIIKLLYDNGLKVDTFEVGLSEDGWLELSPWFAYSENNLMKLKELSVTSPLFYRDLTKYPQIMAYMRKDKEKNHDRFLEFMQRGVNEGYFRSEVNYDLIGHLFDAVGSFMMEHLFEKYRFEELFVNMIFVPLRGFCTSKGVKVLDQFLTQHSKANTNKDE